MAPQDLSFYNVKVPFLTHQRLWLPGILIFLDWTNCSISRRIVGITNASFAAWILIASRGILIWIPGRCFLSGNPLLLVGPLVVLNIYILTWWQDAHWYRFRLTARRIFSNAIHRKLKDPWYLSLRTCICVKAIYFPIAVLSPVQTVRVDAITFGLLASNVCIFIQLSFTSFSVTSLHCQWRH